MLLLRIACAAAALAVLVLSISLNVFYWWQQMAADWMLRTIYVTLSISAGVLKCALIVIIHRSGGFRANKGLAAVFAVAFLYDVWSGIGFSNMSRAAAARQETELQIKRGNLRNEIAGLEDKLHKLPASRPVAIIEPSLKSARAEAGSCRATADARTDRCKRVAELEIEQAAAEQRAALEEGIAKLKKTLDEAGQVRDADPQVTAIVDWFKGVGLDVRRTYVALAQTVLFLVILEVVPPLAFSGALKPSTPRPAAPTPAHTPAHGPAPAPVAARPARTKVAQVTAAQVLKEIQADPGASQSDIAARLNASKTTVNRRYRELRASGQLPVIN